MNNPPKLTLKGIEPETLTEAKQTPKTQANTTRPIQVDFMKMLYDFVLQPSLSNVAA
jgi:hypothetical protein